MATRARLLGLALLAALGCYNPALGEGDFLCGPNALCPANFKCGADGRCYRSLDARDAATPPVDAPADTRPVMDTRPPADAPTMCNRGLTCSMPMNAPGRVCDPVCQTGCACDRKCAIEGNTVACVPIPAAPAGEYDICEYPGDNCRPGYVCSREARPACGARCYRACRADGDCGPDSRCTEALLDGMDRMVAGLCSPKIEACNPTGATATCMGSGSAARPSPPYACYLLDPGGKDDAAVCDCGGVLDLAAECTGRHQCRPGLECLPDASNANLRCRRLCTLQDNLPPALKVTCLVGNTCRPIGSGMRFGYCL